MNEERKHQERQKGINRIIAHNFERFIDTKKPLPGKKSKQSYFVGSPKVCKCNFVYITQPVFVLLPLEKKTCSGRKSKIAWKKSLETTTSRKSEQMELAQLDKLLVHSE